MTSDLKPCPFCGTTEHLSVISVGSLARGMPSRPMQVRCGHLDCEDVSGPVAYGRRDAITAWNTRADALAGRSDGERVEAVARIIQYDVALEARVPVLAAAIDALYAERIAAAEARAQAAEALVAEAGEALGELLSGHANLYVAHFGPHSDPTNDIAARAARSVYHKITERGE